MSLLRSFCTLRSSALISRTAPSGLFFTSSVKTGASVLCGHLRDDFGDRLPWLAFFPHLGFAALGVRTS